MDQQNTAKTTSSVLFLASIVIFLVASFFLYKTVTLSQTVTILTAQVAQLNKEKALLTTENAATAQELNTASTSILALMSELSLTSEELDELEDDYRKEKNKNDDFQDQIKEIAGTVGDLDKLSKTDEELLQKYSKVSFLNEHYVPSDLSDIKKEYMYDESRKFEFHSDALPYLEDLIEDAKDDGISIWVASAYRSFATQTQLKGAYTVTYGTGANAFSADQGFSEHQLGTTLDFTTTGLGGGLTGFGNTPAFTWLQKNAHKYGFTLSYPDGNAYYVYEPWHWRFVGQDLAEDLKDDGKHFYDLDQRTIDQYLLKIFD